MSEVMVFFSPIRLCRIRERFSQGKLYRSFFLAPQAA